MPKSEVAIPGDGAWATLQKAQTQAERYAAGQYATEAIPVPEFDAPVPRFFFDLPWADDDEATVDTILANLAGAEDLEAATAGNELRKLDAIIGEPVEVFDIRARKSEVDEAKWGAYLTLALSVDGGPQEVISSGHGQVCVTMWRCFMEDRLPVRGVFKKLGTPTKGRNQPIGFMVESPLDDSEGK